MDFVHSIHGFSGFLFSIQLLYNWCYRQVQPMPLNQKNVLKYNQAPSVPRYLIASGYR